MSDRAKYLGIITDALQATIPPCPQKSGSGIVMLGGEPFDVDSYVGLRVLRSTGCQLPVKLYHPHNRTVDPRIARIPGVEVLALPNLGFKSGKIWEYKEVAINLSGFHRVMYLDADAYPVVDPTDQIKGVQDIVFWWDRECSETVFHESIYGTPGTYLLTPQAGVMLVNTVACHWPMSIVRALHQHSDYFYLVSFSDQEIMRCVWDRGRFPYSTFDPARVTSYGTHPYYCYNHKGPDGQPFVVHRTGYKFHERPERLGSCPLEDLAWEYYNEFQGLAQ